MAGPPSCVCPAGEWPERWPCKLTSWPAIAARGPPLSEALTHFTVDEDELAAADVVYEELEGWEGDLGKARRFVDLPAQARTYVQLIEDEVGIPVEMISTGPGREQLLRR